MWLEQKVKAVDGHAEAWFGSAVALHGDYALVGAHNSTVNGAQSQGAVYVFKRNGTHWVQVRKLVAADGMAGDHFGRSLAIRGDMAVICAPLATIGGNLWQGAANVFHRNGDDWTQVQKLVDSHGAAFETFGTCVAFDDGHMLLGSGGSSHAGQRIDRALHVFRRQHASKLPWSQLQTIATPLADDPTSAFAASVAIAGKHALVGAPTASSGGNPGRGIVYAVEEQGGSWVLVDKFSASDGEARANFGLSVWIDEDLAVVGAPGATVHGNVSQGAAYVMQRKGSAWKESHKLTANDGASINLFGASVSIDSHVILVGAYAAENYRGAAYVFERKGGEWVQSHKLQASDGAPGNVYGYYSVTHGKTALVGAYTATVDGAAKRGAAYFHMRT